MSSVSHQAGGAEPTRRRRKFAPFIVLAGLVATVVLATTTSGVLAGFTASISNSANTVGSGTLLMTETQGGTTCLSSAAGTVTAANAGTCATINKYNGSVVAVPGQQLTSTITIKNNGSVTANTFTLAPSACTQSNNGTVNGTALDFCTKMDVTIANTSTNTCVFPASASPCAAPTSANTMTSLKTGGAITLPTVAAGASVNFTFTVMLDSTADNTYQGLAASQPLLWSFAS